MILLTGYKGFMGTHLQRRLTAAGKQLLLVDQDNMNTPIDFTKIEKIYHLGALTDIFSTSLADLVNLNTLYTQKLITSAVQYNIPMVYASTSDVFGTSEPNRTCPLTQYATSKFMIDVWVQDKKFPNVTGLRFYSVYGPGEEKKGAMASLAHQFCMQAYKDKNIKLHDKASVMWIDFTHVDDALDIMTTVTNKPGVFDAGRGQITCVKTLAEAIAAVYGATITTVPFPPELINKVVWSAKSGNHFYTQQTKFVNIMNLIKVPYPDPKWFLRA